MPVPIDINSPPDLQALFQAATAELEEFKPALFVRRSVSRVRVLELSNVMLMSWAPHAERIIKVFSAEYAEQRNAERKRLDTRAWVFYAADLAAEEPFSDEALKERQELAKAVAAHDRLLFKWATPLLGDKPEHAETLRDISRGTGARDDAEDVLRLVSLFRANWGQVKDQQKVITEADLDQAAADAAKQINVLRNAKTNPARKLANAAYSLWYNDYDELMELGRYFARHESDAKVRFPGVREEPSPASKRDANEEPVAEPVEDASADAVEDPAQVVDAEV